MLKAVVKRLLDTGIKPYYIGALLKRDTSAATALLGFAGIDCLMTSKEGHICWGGEGTGIWNTSNGGEPSGLEVMHGLRESGGIALNDSQHFVVCRGGSCPYQTGGKCFPLSGRGRPDSFVRPLTRQRQIEVAKYMAMGHDAISIYRITGYDINAIIAFYCTAPFSHVMCPVCKQYRVIPVRMDEPRVKGTVKCGKCLERHRTSRHNEGG